MRTNSAMISSEAEHEDQHRPAAQLAGAAELHRHRVLATSGMRCTKPASTKPMNAMNRPMPTLIATLSGAGIAWKTASGSR